MKRRDFLKYCALTAAVPTNALAWGPLAGGTSTPGSSNGATASATKYSWADWDESTEGGLNPDQDGDGTEDTFCCFFENTVAGGDEVGQGGGLTVIADRTLSDQGNTNSATGSPPYRQLNGTTDWFDAALAIGNLVINASDTFSIFLKTADANAAVGDGLIYWSNGTLNDTILLRSSAGTARQLEVQAKRDGTLKLNASTSAAWSATGDMMFGIWSDGTYIRAGYKSSKFTKWSDLTANSRVSSTSAIGWSSGDFSQFRRIGLANGNYLSAKLYYMVVSNNCLIDNAS